MGVAFALVGKVPLVITADDQRVAAGQLHGLHILRRILTGPWVFHPHAPGTAVGLGAGGVDVAAHVQQGMGQPALPGRLARLHGGVAFGRSPHIQRHSRIGKGHRQGAGVQQQVVQIAVLQGFGDGICRRRGRILALPGIVPQAQHSPRRNVHRTARQCLTAGLAQLQKVE